MQVQVLSVGFFFFQAEDGIRDLVRSRGLGDVYKRQLLHGGDEIAAQPGVVTDDLRHRLAGDPGVEEIGEHGRAVVAPDLSLIHI